MIYYRIITDHDKNECGSKGCVIGHCIELDDWKNIQFKDDGEINFELWSEHFTGLYSISNFWHWCFGAKWPNNKKQILLRLKYFIDNQTIPKEWMFRRDYSYLLPFKKLETYELD